MNDPQTIKVEIVKLSLQLSRSSDLSDLYGGVNRSAMHRKRYLEANMNYLN